MIENEIQSAIKPILDIYSKMELELIAKIVEHFSINEKFTNSDYWYLEKLKEFGGLNSETIKLLEKYTGKTKQELLKAMKAIGINSIPIDQLNIAKQRSILLNPNKIINSVNIQNIIKYSYNELEKTFLNLNKTIQEQVRQTYTDIITETYIKTNAGVCSYQEAILDSLDALGDKGITILTYQDKNGLKRNYDVVGTVRRDLLVATRGLAGKVNEEVIKESGNHIIRVTNHFGARTGDGGENYTNHAWWQEKQFFCWNYDGKATEEEKKLPDFMEHCNYGDVRGIVGINCKHLFTVWYGSIKKEDLEFTYDENEEQYEKTQHQRYLENGVRKWKRKQIISQKAKDEEGYKKASSKTREWQERLKKFTEENNLIRDYTREHVKNYKAVTKSDNIKSNGEITQNNLEEISAELQNVYMYDKITVDNLLDRLNITVDDYKPFGKYDPFDNNIQEQVSELLKMNNTPVIDRKKYEDSAGTEVIRVVHSYHGQTAQQAYENTIKGEIQYSENTNSSFGRGIYFGDKSIENYIISSYSGKTNDFKIINAKIDANAKILEFENQLEYTKDLVTRLSKVPDNLKEFFSKEKSLLYMLDGIDGIKLKWNNYYCIYNRGVLIIYE